MTSNPHPKRRWFQFRLLTLFLFVLVVAVSLATYCWHNERQRAEHQILAEIWRRTGSAYVDFDWSGLVSTIGILEVYRVEEIPKNETQDDAIKAISQLSSLPNLHIQSNQVTDRGMAALERLPKLTKLTLHCPRVTAAGLAHLNAAKHLTQLWLACPHATGDEFAETLTKHTHIQNLALYGMPVSEDVLHAIRTLPRLDSLAIGSPSNPSVWLDQLKQMPNLRTLMLWGAWPKDEVEKIRAALPAATYDPESDPILDGWIAHNARRGQ
jgi:hypothetical protein